MLHSGEISSNNYKIPGNYLFFNFRSAHWKDRSQGLSAYAENWILYQDIDQPLVSLQSLSYLFPLNMSNVFIQVTNGNLSLTIIISLMSKVFANGSRDRGSIPGQVISKDSKILIAAALLNTQHYKVRIKSKVE